jgi:putative addiction module component (TIGR02574 family)
LEKENQASATRRIGVSFGVLSRQARKHSPDDRIELSYNLLQSVDDEEDPEYERLWMEEIERRYRDFEEGRIEAIPGDQVLAELRAKLASMKHAPEIQEDAESVRPFEEIRRDALQLPVDERLDLAYAILRDLETEGFQIDWERPEVVGRSRTPHTVQQ